MQGTLPWIHIEVNNAADAKKMKGMKERLDKQWFIKFKIPIQPSQLLEIDRNRKKLSTIDYLDVNFKLISALKSINQQNDFHFDWTGLLKVTHNSPDKKIQQKQKINKINQSNQKHVQQEIYQIYKFIKNDNEKIHRQHKQVKNINFPKKLVQNEIAYVGTKQKIEQQKQLKNRKRIESIKKIERSVPISLKSQQKIKRPVSSMSARKQSKIETQKMKYSKQMAIKMNILQNAKDMGPKIVINYPANYRL